MKKAAPGPAFFTARSLLVSYIACGNHGGINLNKQPAIPVHQIEHHVLRSQWRLERQRGASVAGDGKGPGERLAEGDAAGIVEIDNAGKAAGAIGRELRNRIQLAAAADPGEVQAIGAGERSA